MLSTIFFVRYQQILILNGYTVIFHNCHHAIKGAHEKSPCTICGDMITKYGKNQHFKEKHPDSDLCICQNCGQKFHTTESLRKHIGK